MQFLLKIKMKQRNATQRNVITTDLLSWLAIDSRSLTIVVWASDGFDADVAETVVFGTSFFIFPKKFIILKKTNLCVYCSID